jgi:hypothetical protein
MMNDILVLAIFGLLGGIIRHIWSHQGKLILPHNVFDAQGNLALDMGFLYNSLTGIVTGTLIPYGLGAIISLVLPGFPQLGNNPVTALLAGYSSPHFFEKIIEFVEGKIQPGVPTTSPAAVPIK